MRDAPKQTRRGILAGLSASVATPAAADDDIAIEAGTAPEGVVEWDGLLLDGWLPLEDSSCT